MEFREGTDKVQEPKRGGDMLRRVLIGVLIFLLAAGALAAYALAATPQSVRNPAFAHYHARLIVVSDGKKVDFSQNAFQQTYDKGSCSAQVTTEPFHFHDGLDQFLHVHWDGMTGGQLLKYYGWNEVGGLPGSLGVKTGGPGGVRPIPVPGGLPERADSAEIFVYTGTAENFERRSTRDFLGTEIENFLKGQRAVSWFERVIPAAHAHDGSDHAGRVSALTEEEKVRLNNLRGNIVIFARDKAPSDDEVREQFERLVPLPESACAG